MELASCSFLGITVEVEKENKVGGGGGAFKHKASPNTSLGEGGVWGGAYGCKKRHQMTAITNAELGHCTIANR